jgi:hypothetical protein
MLLETFHWWLTVSANVFRVTYHSRKYQHRYASVLVIIGTYLIYETAVHCDETDIGKDTALQACLHDICIIREYL